MIEKPTSDTAQSTSGVTEPIHDRSFSQNRNDVSHSPENSVDLRAKSKDVNMNFIQSDIANGVHVHGSLEEKPKKESQRRQALKETWRLLPPPIEINTAKVAPVVTIYNPIGVQHRDNLKHKILPQRLCMGIIAR